MATFAVLHVEKDDDWVNIDSHLESIIFVKQVKISHNFGVSIFVLLLGLTVFVQF
jgi:hypothetical protein